MKKIIITSFLSLTILTIIPLFGMTETKVSKDTSMSVATPFTQTTNSIDEDEKRTKNDFEEALQSYKINPKQIDLVVKDLKDRSEAQANSFFKCIDIDKCLVGSDDLTANFRIFAAYHEAGHLYDKANHKRLFVELLYTALGATLGALVSTAVKCLSNNESSILKDIASDTTLMALLGTSMGALTYPIWGNSYAKKREKEADRLAIEHLLQDKKYKPIVVTLLFRLRRMQTDNGSDENHPPFKEMCKNMIKYVRDNGFTIVFKSNDQDISSFEKERELRFKPQSVICLQKEDTILAWVTSKSKLPELSTDD